MFARKYIFFLFIAVLELAAGFLTRLPLSSQTGSLLEYLQPSFIDQSQVGAHPLVKRQRKSVGSIQMMGLFGLGLGEIGVILLVVAFVLGPQTLGKLARGSVAVAKEYKEELSKVPEEFQKGLEEGEADARARKARPIRPVAKKTKEDE